MFAANSVNDFTRHLGELVISPSYVLRRCKEDERYYGKIVSWLCLVVYFPSFSYIFVISIWRLPNQDKQKIISNEPFNVKSNNISIDRMDAGVSLIMHQKYSLEERIPLLLIHGMLHLVGYDHETESDWTRMTAREQQIYEIYSKGKT